MDAQSGQYKAGHILLLVGAILAVVGSAFLVLAGIFLIWLDQSILGDEADRTLAPAVIGALYLAFGVVGAVGSVFGFRARAKALAGDAHGAWIAGLVAALVPPLQVLPLIGAILILTSPEHARQQGGATS